MVFISLMRATSPRPGGPGNPVNEGLLCDRFPRRHLVHQSFISTCGYLSQQHIRGQRWNIFSLKADWELWYFRSVPGWSCCLRRSPSAWRSWGCPCSSWCGSAGGRASGRRSPRSSRWSRRPSNESLDWTCKRHVHSYHWPVSSQEHTLLHRQEGLTQFQNLDSWNSDWCFCA